MIPKDTISLRPPDLNKLGVAEGDEVEVFLHQTILQGIHDGWEGVKEKWGGWVEKVKDKFGKDEETEDED
jgi:hypothetical protein